MRFWHRETRYDPIPELREMQVDYPLAAGYVGDMILYAQVGRDRRKFDSEYTRMVREEASRIQAEWEKYA